MNVSGSDSGHFLAVVVKGRCAFSMFSLSFPIYRLKREFQRSRRLNCRLVGAQVFFFFTRVRKLKLRQIWAHLLHKIRKIQQHIRCCIKLNVFSQIIFNIHTLNFKHYQWLLFWLSAVFIMQIKFATFYLQIFICFKFLPIVLPLNHNCQRINLETKDLEQIHIFLKRWRFPKTKEKGKKSFHKIFR